MIFQAGSTSRFQLSTIEENDEKGESSEGEDEEDAGESLRIIGDSQLPRKDATKETGEPPVFRGTDITPSQVLRFTPDDVAQAFSHFSYIATGRKRLICDIQGVFDEDSNRLMISDPAIHYFNPRKEDRRQVHGRSDLGLRGVQRFFQSHQCSKLCSLVTFGLKHKRKRSQLGKCEDKTDLAPVHVR